MRTLATATPATMTGPGNPLEILVSPAAFFERVRSGDAPSFWMPTILISLSSWGFTALCGWLVGFDQIAANEMALRGIAVTDPSISGRISAAFMLSWPFTFVLTTLLASVVLYAVFALAMGYELTLRQTMAVLFFSHLPRIIRFPLCLIPLLIGSATREHFLTSNPLATNPGFFYLDSNTNRGLLLALSSLDLFTFWTLALVARGVSIISKQPFVTTAVVVLLCWALLLALKVLMA
jgi:hypothetical protein